MHILVDITHPAHVHFFKHAIKLWQDHSHQVSITARDKDIATNLLACYGFDYINLGSARKGLTGLTIEMVLRDTKLLGVMRKLRPDVLVGIGGVFIAQVGYLTATPSIVFTDTENATLSNLLTFPFANSICTPSCYKTNVPRRKHVIYEGYHELAYLHPNWFTPDPAILREVGIAEDEPFTVLRFVSWGSSHDINLRGFSVAGKERLVERLEQFGRVIITSEAALPPRFEPYRLAISPAKIHHLLAYASLYIGESATMASESAVLGTPAIFVSPVGRGYTDEQEQRYGLVRNFSNRPEDEEAAIAQAADWLGRRDLEPEWQARRNQMLQEKIDVTCWMGDFVEQRVRKER